MRTVCINYFLDLNFKPNWLKICGEFSEYYSDEDAALILIRRGEKIEKKFKNKAKEIGQT